MNKDTVKGAAKQVIGEAQRQYGKVTDQPSQQLKGDVKKATGAAQSAFGKATDDAK